MHESKQARQQAWISFEVAMRFVRDEKLRAEIMAHPEPMRGDPPYLAHARACRTKCLKLGVATEADAFSLLERCLRRLSRFTTLVHYRLRKAASRRG